MADKTSMAPGLYLAGRILSIAPGKVWTNRNGQEQKPIDITVDISGEVHPEPDPLTGRYNGRTQRVQYSDQASADAAGAIGTVGLIRVFVRAQDISKDPGRKDIRLFYSGETVNID